MADTKRIPCMQDSTDSCTGCAACKHICSRNALSMRKDAAGFSYPVINRSVCTDCGLCAGVCPVYKSRPAGLHQTNAAGESYALICNDEKIRAESSSGGAFTLFADKVLEAGGAVFGAEFDEVFNVRLGYAETDAGLKKFRGSKYVQADAGNSYAECKRFLDGGRQVLFSGTPCQCAGLVNFLQKPYENLIVVDFVCLGVPSPDLWRKYLLYRETEAASRAVKVSFRSKVSGWDRYSMELVFDSSSMYCRPKNEDTYLQLFMHKAVLRESCYSCKFKGASRVSDITLADFWGAGSTEPDMDDGRGTSLVFVNSPKGRALFDSVKDWCRVKKTDAGAALRFNPFMVRSAKRPRKRSRFGADLNRMAFETLYKKYGRDSFIVRARIFAAQCVHKILGK